MGMSGVPIGGAPVNGAPSYSGGRLGVNGIAVVDIAYIFKTYQKFKQQTDEMKTRVQAAEADINKDQDGIKRKAEELRGYNSGSPDYKKAENDLVRMQADLQLKVSLQKKDFMEQEGKIYFNVSREVEDAVKQIAIKNGIVLVLRFNGDPVDGNNREDILRDINKGIVYYDHNMDITPAVLVELNRSAGANPGMIGVRPQTPVGIGQPPR